MLSNVVLSDMIGWIHGFVYTGLIRLATEVSELTELEESLESAEESGFGLNPDILGSNLINIVIILGLLIYLARNVVGDVLSKRRAQIIKELEDAEQRQKASMEQLADQQQKLAQAQQEAERIKQQAETNAQRVREELLAQADQDMARMRADADRDVSSQRERVITELRRQLIAQTIAKVEADLPQQLNDATQNRLIDQSIQLLGGQG